MTITSTMKMKVRNCHAFAIQKIVAGLLISENVGMKFASSLMLCTLAIFFSFRINFAMLILISPWTCIPIILRDPSL